MALIGDDRGLCAAATFLVAAGDGHLGAWPVDVPLRVGDEIIVHGRRVDVREIETT